VGFTLKTNPKLNPILQSCYTLIMKYFITVGYKTFKIINLEIFGYLFDVDNI